MMMLLQNGGESSSPEGRDWKDEQSRSIVGLVGVLGGSGTIDPEWSLGE